MGRRVCAGRAVCAVARDWLRAPGRWRGHGVVSGGAPTNGLAVWDMGAQSMGFDLWGSPPLRA